MVNFFASWCTPCLGELPRFEGLHRRLGTSVRFLGMDLQDTVADGRDVVNQTGVRYDIGRDPEGRVLEAISGVVMPTTVLLDANGRVVKLVSGEISGDELERAIHAELLR